MTFLVSAMVHCNLSLALAAPPPEGKRGRGRPRKNPLEPSLKKIAAAGPEGRPVAVDQAPEEKEKKKRGRKCVYAV